MIDDAALRRRLRAEAEAHDPDTNRIRSRFDAGCRGFGEPGPAERRTARRRLTHTVRPAAWAVAAACAATVVAVVNQASVASFVGRQADWSAVGREGNVTATIPAQVSGSLAPPGPSGIPTVRMPSPGAASAGGSTSASGTSTSPRSAETTRSGAPPSPQFLAAPAAKSCAPLAAVPVAPYWISNNLWGASSGTGWQCLWPRSTAGPAVSWSTEWSWSGDPSQVKSFSSVVLGWHWGWQVPNSGLPVALADHRSIHTRWQFDVTEYHPGAWEEAYDLWLHTESNPGPNTSPAVEVSVVVSKTSRGPASMTRLGTVTVGGANWDLYRGNKTWDIYAFVRTENTSAVDLDLTDFTDVLSTQYGLRSGLYLSSVEAGVAVLGGSGKLDSPSYSVQIGHPRP